MVDHFKTKEKEMQKKRKFIKEKDNCGIKNIASFSCFSLMAQKDKCCNTMMINTL